MWHSINFQDTYRPDGELSADPDSNGDTYQVIPRNLTPGWMCWGLTNRISRADKRRRCECTHRVVVQVVTAGLQPNNQHRLDRVALQLVAAYILGSSRSPQCRAPKPNHAAWSTGQMWLIQHCHRDIQRCKNSRV
jgi:hypothetical protein